MSNTAEAVVCVRFGWERDGVHRVPHLVLRVPARQQEVHRGKHRHGVSDDDIDACNGKVM